MDGAKLQGFEQSSSSAAGSDYDAAAYESNRGLLVERLQQAVPPQRTPRGCFLKSTFASQILSETRSCGFEWKRAAVAIAYCVPLASQPQHLQYCALIEYPMLAQRCCRLRLTSMLAQPQ
jgi:hypothetical protein